MKPSNWLVVDGLLFWMEQGRQQSIDKHRKLNPDIVNAVESKSRSNLYRYLAAIAYEGGEIKRGLYYIKESVVSAPLLFLRTGRSHLVTGALLARGVLAADNMVMGIGYSN